MPNLDKPAFPHITTTQLKSDLGELKQAIESGKKADGTVDLAKVKQRIDTASNPGLKKSFDAIERWFQRSVPGMVLGGGCGNHRMVPGTVKKPPEDLKAAEITTVLDALIQAGAQIDGFDKNHDGTIQRAEQYDAGVKIHSHSGRPEKDEQFALDVAQGASAAYDKELGAWQRVIRDIRRDKADRPALEQAFVRKASQHAATTKGAEAIAWHYRERAVTGQEHTDYFEGTQLVESHIDSWLNAKETSFLRHVPLFSGLALGQGHLSDSEVEQAFGVNDLDAFIDAKKAAVEQRVGNYQDYLAGKDLVDISQHDGDPDLNRY